MPAPAGTSRVMGLVCNSWLIALHVLIVLNVVSRQRTKGRGTVSKALARWNLKNARYLDIRDLMTARREIVAAHDNWLAQPQNIVRSQQGGQVMEAKTKHPGNSIRRKLPRLKHQLPQARPKRL